MLGKQTCSFLENMFWHLLLCSLLFMISLLTDIKEVVKCWICSVRRFKFIVDALKSPGLYLNVDLI